jgi:hypothetical protein
VEDCEINAREESHVEFDGVRNIGRNTTQGPCKRKEQPFYVDVNVKLPLFTLLTIVNPRVCIQLLKVYSR